MSNVMWVSGKISTVAKLGSQAMSYLSRIKPKRLVHTFANFLHPKVNKANVINKVGQPTDFTCQIIKEERLIRQL